MSDYLWPHGLQPARFLCPWNFPGKDIRVGLHFFLLGSSQPRDQTYVFLRLLHCQGDFLATANTHTHIHLFFVHTSVDGHLGCFWVLAIVNSAAMNTGVHLFKLQFVSLLDICLEQGLLDCTVTLFQLFKDAPYWPFFFYFSCYTFSVLLFHLLFLLLKFRGIMGFYCSFFQCLIPVAFSNPFYMSVNSRFVIYLNSIVSYTLSKPQVSDL